MSKQAPQLASALETVPPSQAKENLNIRQKVESSEIVEESENAALKARKKRGVKYALNKNKYLLQPEVERLEHILTSYIEKNERDCLLIIIALKTGARAQEILNLTKGDLNSYDQTLYIRGIKGSNDREIPVKSDIFNRLNRLTATLQAHDLVFPISYNRFRQIWEHYRPIPKKLHALRHTFAIRLYQKTKDIRLVQVALGHRNIMNTMIYADYVYSQQELRKLIL